MALGNAFDTRLHFSELADPLDTQEGVLTSTVRKARVLAAMGVPVTADLAKIASITNGTVAASKAAVVDANKDIAGFRNLRATRVVEGRTATSDATAGARTWTAAEVLGGILVRDPAGAGRTDVLPTAALLVAALPGAAVGDTIKVKIINGADAAETITLDAGAGGGYDTNQTAAARVIPQFHSKVVEIRLTNVTAASEAYVVYM